MGLQRQKRRYQVLIWVLSKLRKGALRVRGASTFDLNLGRSRKIRINFSPYQTPKFFQTRVQNVFAKDQKYGLKGFRFVFEIGSACAEVRGSPGSALGREVGEVWTRITSGGTN
eukprot:1335947-Amorphochlora_amoeboformis.AAC.2